MTPMTIIQLMRDNRITSPFGERIHPVTGKKTFHNGVDIAIPEGTPIAAHKDMVCINTWEDDVGGLQTKVTDDKYIYGLAHLSRCNVRKGDRIMKGEVFAVTGNTGRSTGAHLHLTLRDKFTIKLLDPLKHLKILVFIIVSFLFLSGCSASWHVKRALIKESPQYVLNEITSKYPEFIKQQREVIYDTIITHIRGIDTIKVMKEKDTLIINKNNQIIHIYRHYDTIRVLSEGRIDTILKTITIPKYIVTEKIDNSNVLNKLLLILFALIILILLVFAIIKKIRL